MKRIWVDNPSEDVLYIVGAEHNHIANVLRARVGDQITVISGDGFDRLYAVSEIGKRQTALRFIAKTENKCNPTRVFTVFLACIKPDALSFAVQKLNEIGVSELKLFTSERTAVSVKSLNVPRLNEIARQSCKQCGRSIPLRVSYIKNLRAEIAENKKSDVMFLDEKQGRGALPATAHAIIVGPEGGFSPAERAALAEIATPVGFGNAILRAETAAVVGAAKWCI